MSRRTAKQKPAPLASVTPIAPAAPAMRQDDFVTAVLGQRMLAQRSNIVGLSAMMRYTSGGLYARVVDMPADKATDRGVIIEGDDEKKIAGEFDRLGVLPLMSDCLRWAMLTGGAGIVMLANDGGQIDDELSEEGLREIVELRVYPGSDFAPEPERYEDPNSPKFGYPIRYRITSNGFSFVVHESRIIPVTGGPIPRQSNTTNVPWMGRQEVQRAYKAICRYESSLDYTENILQRKQQAVYGMKGMADLLKNASQMRGTAGGAVNGEQLIQARIAAVDATRGIINTVATDSEDTYTIIDNNLGGIKDTVGEMKSAVCAEVGIPVTLLFEESPGGMNATGESDFEGWHEKVQTQQKRLQKPMERLVSLIQLQDNIKPLADDWKVCWPPLKSPTEAQQAEVDYKRAQARKTEIEALSAAVDSAILSERQAAESAAALGLYEINGLDDNTGRGAAVDYAQQT